jgi:hypothetical protein
LTTPVTDPDAVILSIVDGRWRKVAMVIAKTSREIEKLSGDWNYEQIAARIEALVADGVIESAGNLAHWRHSEIRRRSTPPSGLASQ